MLTIEQLHFSYGDQPILTNLNVTIEEEKITAIIGPNGAGKSTLLKLIMGILTPTRGQIRLQGRSIQSMGRKDRARVLGYLPQEFTTPFAFRVEEVVGMGRFPYSKALGVLSSGDKAIIEEAMRATDILKFRHRPFNQLSGGEKQRVMLASVLAQQTPLLLLDEPLRALDYAHQAQILQVLQQEHLHHGKTILWVTHDVNLAGRFAHTIICMKNGKFITSGPPDAILKPEILETLYGISMTVHWLPDKRPVVMWAASRTNQEKQ